MATFLDTHVHVYPSYSLALLCQAARAHVASHRATLAMTTAPPSDLALLLTERAQEQWFNSLRAHCGGTIESIQVSASPDPLALWLHDGQTRILVCAGRQVVSTERIEVLGLCCELPASVPQPAARVIESILDAGGVPVLPWSPGKWWLERGKAVRELFSTYGPSLFAGDIALRPSGMPFPALLRYAAATGHFVLAGTDPLPMSGEERAIASYVSYSLCSIDEEHPSHSIRSMLQGSTLQVGRQNSPLQALSRWLRARR